MRQPQVRFQFGASNDRHVARPTIPDCIEQQRSNSGRATRAVAARFRQAATELERDSPMLAARFDETAWRLSRCVRAGRNRSGYRCGSALCPRCARQRAIGYHERLAARMQLRAAAGAAPHGFALLTLTVATGNPREGVRLFKRAWKRFFRRQSFRRAVSGGEAHIQPEPARGDDSGKSWNVHAHAIVELGRPMNEVALTSLQAAWAKILAQSHATGSADLQQRGNLKLEFFTSDKAAIPSRSELRHT